MARSWTSDSWDYLEMATDNFTLDEIARIMDEAASEWMEGIPPYAAGWGARKDCKRAREELDVAEPAVSLELRRLFRLCGCQIENCRAQNGRNTLTANRRHESDCCPSSDGMNESAGTMIFRGG